MGMMGILSFWRRRYGGVKTGCPGSRIQRGNQGGFPLEPLKMALFQHHSSLHKRAAQENRGNGVHWVQANG